MTSPSIQGGQGHRGEDIIDTADIVAGLAWFAGLMAGCFLVIWAACLGLVAMFGV